LSLLLVAATLLYDHYNKSAQAACACEHYHVTGTAPRPPTASPLTAHAAPRGQFVSAGESAAGSLLPSSWSRPLTVTCCTDAPTAPCRPSAGGRGERRLLEAVPRPASQLTTLQPLAPALPLRSLPIRDLQDATASPFFPPKMAARKTAFARVNRCASSRRRWR
jgi:hypothetical protein